jgi:hypothetical protein
MTQMLLKETQTPTSAPQSPKRRWVRFAAPVAAVVILIAIAAAVVTSRSDEVSEPVERSAEEVHPADRHLLNQAARIQAQRRSAPEVDGSDRHLLNQAQRLDAHEADAERFAGRYSIQTPEINGSDRHLLNEAEKVEARKVE